MTDRVLPSEQIATPLIELLRGTPLAADACELGRLVRMSLRDQFAVAVLVRAEEAETTQGALDSMAQRDEAHARALKRRSRFGVAGES